MKHLYRALYLIAVFIGALYFFGQNNLKTAIFDIKKSTTDMSSSTLPGVTLRVGDTDINHLYGYTSNLNAMLIRESITPLTSEQTFTVVISENGSVVKKVKYELLDVSTGDGLESGEISALTEEEYYKYVRIKLKTSMESGKEYMVKLTLITGTSKRIYFYTRVKCYSNGMLTEKLAYVDELHTAFLEKDNIDTVTKYLEPKGNKDNSTFALVDIHSSVYVVSWGDLNPTVVYEMPPTITEFYEEMASVVRSFVISVETDSGLEYYHVRESYRILYTTIRPYLYNYEREMETLYDPDFTSISQNDLKLGITSDLDMEIFTTSNYAYTSFVRERELWCYDKAKNTMVCVFSFNEDDSDYNLELCDNHNVKILNQSANGNIDFVVYGYMNRGIYEGRVGIVLYRYYASENRIEERAYFPVNATYEILKCEVNSFIYLNNNDILYILIFDTIYSYNLSTCELTVVEEQVPQSSIVFYREESMVAWQRQTGNAENISIHIMNLESGAEYEITAPEGELVRLYGEISDNLIYGYAFESDTVQNSDGTWTVPAYRLIIADFDGTVLKEYSKAGCYVVGAVVSDNIITMTRVKKSTITTLAYEGIENDYIQNMAVSSSLSVSIVSRVTDLMLTEYYISFPAGFSISETPGTIYSKNTVITRDTTVRVTEDENLSDRFYTYSYGRIVLVTTDCVLAIASADEDENVGAVIDSDGKVVWERGVKASRSSISGLTSFYTDSGMTSLQACMKTLFTYRNLTADTAGFDFMQNSVISLMEEYMGVTPLYLKGCSLDQVLYYVYKKRPVMVITGYNEAYLITAYDSENVEMINPKSRTTLKITRKQAEEIFAESGSVYICYVE